MKRRVAELGEESDFSEIELDLLTSDQLSQLRTFFPAEATSQLDYDLQEVAGEYRRQREQKPHPRGETIFQVKMVAHLSWLQARCVTTKVSAELASLLDELNDDARMTLGRSLRVAWEEIDSNLDKLYSWPEICDAATSAVRNSSATGGDYADVDLRIAVAGLVDIFRCYAGEEPTWSGKRVGPLSIDGGQRQVAGSHAGQFIQMFFQFIDPKMPATAAHNALRVILNNVAK